MSLTPSNMPKLGIKAPDFSLLEPASGKMISIGDLNGSAGILVAFISNHCPYVHHIQAELTRLGKDLDGSDISMVAIGSNDAENYPEDGPDEIASDVIEQGYVFPYLHDATQEVAHAYGAACTPDFFLYDSDRRLVYRGQLDSSRPGNGNPVDGADLRMAITALREEWSDIVDQLPSVGCNIKWRPGNEPETR